jgi:esterase/lipase superfamily enzyme
MNREYHRWPSPSLERDMELLVFGHAGTKVLVFPTRDGRFHEYEDIRMVETLGPKIRDGGLQLFCVDSVDHESFYCFWCAPEDRIKRHNQFERYVLEEVIPFMDALNPHPDRIAHGCSLGAYHAVNIAFRHPARFRKVVAFSGRYDLTLAVEEFTDLFEGYYDEEIYFHLPSHYVPNLECEDILARLRSLDILLVVGDEDPFLANNRQFSDLLRQKGIGHAFHVWQGRAHRGHYWRQMAALYL